jgi:guanosine-3',5'-bis(diphosphate) 3'-pyrophosphohydrolase
VDSREQTRADRRGGLLSRLRPGEPQTARESFDALVRNVRSYNAKADLKQLQRAYALAEASHEGQKRLSGEDFVEHPLAVATILADLRLDTTSLVAALLHDTVEDTDVSLQQLEEEFGAEVTRIVDGLTKLDALTFHSREQEQAENVRKMIVAMAGDIRVLLIKLADRLHNMRTLAALRPEKQTLTAT